MLFTNRAVVHIVSTKQILGINLIYLEINSIFAADKFFLFKKRYLENNLNLIIFLNDIEG